MVGLAKAHPNRIFSSLENYQQYQDSKHYWNISEFVIVKYLLFLSTMIQCNQCVRI